MSELFKMVDNMEGHFNHALSVQEISWAKECAFAKQHLLRSDFLLKTASKNTTSLQHAIVNVASIGISLNPANKHAYLVPRDGMVCLDVSYIGLMHLAMESGAIVWGQAKLVYENDTYENNGIDKPPTHKQKTFGEKGAIVGAYCTVKLPGGDYLTEEMDMDAINKIRGTSKASNGPWKTWPEEMMRKSVVKRASKYWPQCSRMNTAIEVLNEHEGLIETANSYTPKQKDIFFDLIAEDDALGIYLFERSLCDGENQNIEAWTRLVSAYQETAPKGNKGKYAEHIKELSGKGCALFDAISQGLAENDDMMVLECLDGASNVTIKALLSKVPNEYLDELKGVLSERNK